MSALPRLAGIVEGRWHVRFVPNNGLMHRSKHPITQSPRRQDHDSGPDSKVDKLLNLAHLVLDQPVGQIAARYNGEHLAAFHNR
jgi:hypothetical protein